MVSVRSRNKVLAFPFSGRVFIYKTPLDKILAVGDQNTFRPWGKAEYFDTVTKTWINIADYPKFSESNKSKSFDTI